MGSMIEEPPAHDAAKQIHANQHFDGLHGKAIEVEINNVWCYCNNYYRSCGEGHHWKKQNAKFSVWMLRTDVSQNSHNSAGLPIQNRHFHILR